MIGSIMVAQDSPDNLKQLLGNGIPAKQTFNSGPTCLSHLGCLLRVERKFYGSLRMSFSIAWWAKKTCILSYIFLNAANVRCDNRESTCHRFQQCIVGRGLNQWEKQG